MPSKKSPLNLAALLLILLGIGIAGYRHFILGVPLLPGQRAEVWDVEAQIHLQAEDGPITVSMALPEPGENYSILDTMYAAPGYGFRITNQGGVSRAEWTRRQALGGQTLYYKVKIKGAVAVQPSEPPASLTANPPPHPVFVFPEFDGADKLAADALIARSRARSADEESFVSLLLGSINPIEHQPEAKPLIDLLESENNPNNYSHTDLVMRVLQDAGLAVRKVNGIILEEARRNQALVEMVEVYADGQWIIFDSQTGRRGRPDNFFPWQRGGVSLLDVTGGHNSSITFSSISRSVPLEQLAVTQGQEARAALTDFSLYALPIEEQNAYRYILLVPICTLIVVLLRILVGLRTSGTFMPVLMALAFLQTKLLPGLTIFLTIVSIGLWIRFVLSRLNLLLVARISAVVIVVVGIMAAMSIFSYKLGIQQAMSVTFFPMIILAWTIERMSILWEEEGPREVLVSGGGSLLVAVLCYFAITKQCVEHLVFNFPELLLMILGVTLILGQYTGYRLLELKRFRPLVANTAER